MFIAPVNYSAAHLCFPRGFSFWVFCLFVWVGVSCVFLLFFWFGVFVVVVCSYLCSDSSPIICWPIEPISLAGSFYR